MDVPGGGKNMPANPKPSDVKCGSCGVPIDEPSNTPIEERVPCPACGSKIRRIEKALTENQPFHEQLKHKAKHGGKGKPFIEGKSGDDLHKKSGKWMQREMTVNREKDQYKEVVTDPQTGEVIHHCEEPLSKHQYHGSAKKKQPGQKA